MNLEQVNLKTLSYALAYEISKAKKQSHNQRYINYYILQNIISGIFEFLVIISICTLLGVLPEAIAASIVFSSIRMYSGGYHAKTLTRCLLYTTVIIILVSLLSHYIHLYNHYILYINFGLFLFTFIMIYKNAPCSNRHIQLISHKKHKKLLIKSMLATMFWLFLSVYLITGNLYINIAFSIGVTAFTVGALLAICIDSNLIKISDNNCANSAQLK